MSELYGRSLFHYETDSDGVCHFSNYLRIGEEAFYHLLKASSDVGSFAVVESQVRYMHPLRFGSRFEVAIDRIEMRRSNFELYLSIYEPALNASERKVNAELKLRFVSIDPKTWQVMPLPETIKIGANEYVRSRDPSLAR